MHRTTIDKYFASVPLEAYGYLLFTIIFGTMIAFWFYVESLQSLSAKETSLLGSAEPLAAVATTVIWLQEPFGLFQMVRYGVYYRSHFINAIESPKAAYRQRQITFFANQSAKEGC